MFENRDFFRFWKNTRYNTNTLKRRIYESIHDRTCAVWFDFNERRKAKPMFTLYGIVFRGAKTAIRYGMNSNDPWLHKSFTHIEHRGSVLVNIRRKARSSLMIFTQGRTLLCFYLTLKWYFKLEIIQESASLFNLKEKKLIWGARGLEPMT